MKGIQIEKQHKIYRINEESFDRFENPLPERQSLMRCWSAKLRRQNVSLLYSLQRRLSMIVSLALWVQNDQGWKLKLAVLSYGRQRLVTAWADRPMVTVVFDMIETFFDRNYRQVCRTRHNGSLKCVETGRGMLYQPCWALVDCEALYS